MSYLDFQNEVIPDINRSRNITEQSMCPYFLCMSTSQLKLMRHVYDLDRFYFGTDNDVKDL